MNKRVEGTFSDYEDLKETINNLLGQGYTARQLLVLTRNAEGKRLAEETTVGVTITNDHEESLWDKIKSFFTVELDDDGEDDEDEIDEEDIFEDYGIDEDTYERFEEALEDGEYLLLVDDAPPAQQEHSDFMVRDGIIPEEDHTMNKDFNDKTAKSAKPDWASSDDKPNGDMEQHTIDAAIDAGAHPDPMPGETEADHVEAEIPSSAHPDPLPAQEDAPNPDLEEDVTGEPIEADDPHGDPTMADENQKLEPMQYDETESHPEADDDDQRVSVDPFGGETEDADAENVEPDYEETDKNPPAL